MERWIQMHFQIMEREKATKIAKLRELFLWASPFYIISMAGMIYRQALHWTKLLFPLAIPNQQLQLFYSRECSAPIIYFRYKLTKRSNNLIPIVPLTFTVAYLGDYAYGSKISRIRGPRLRSSVRFNTHIRLILHSFYDFHAAEADMIIQNEPELLEWPRGLPTVSSIDQARVEAEIEKKLHPW